MEISMERSSQHSCPREGSNSELFAHFFLNLIEKHFPGSHKYRKIFNKNNLNISYSCIQNIKYIINPHNRKIIYEINDLKQQEKCNCINKPECPLNNECQATNRVYKAKITSNLENYKEKAYIGISEVKFKLRYANHKKLFVHRKCQKETELSNEFGKIKIKI